MVDIKIDKEKLRRQKNHQGSEQSEEKIPDPIAGQVASVIGLSFNPSREKIREMTIIDRMQGRLLPLLDVVNTGRKYIIEVALYRQDPAAYEKLYLKKEPLAPNLLDEFIYRLAQWQKSVGGENLKKATDIALAEMEVKDNDEEGIGGSIYDNQ